MGIVVDLKEQLRLERQRNLALQTEKEEMENLMLNQLVDLDFRQSLTELEVDINDL